jgi:hypothetical protein
MRRDRRAYLLGFAAGKRAARAEFDAEFESIKADIRATRRHLDNVVALDNVDRLMSFDSPVLH